ESVTRPTQRMLARRLQRVGLAATCPLKCCPGKIEMLRRLFCGQPWVRVGNERSLEVHNPPSDRLDVTRVEFHSDSSVCWAADFPSTTVRTNAQTNSRSANAPSTAPNAMSTQMPMTTSRMRTRGVEN